MARDRAHADRADLTARASFNDHPHLAFLRVPARPVARVREERLDADLRLRLIVENLGPAVLERRRIVERHASERLPDRVMAYAVLEPGIVGGVHAEDRQGGCKQKTTHALPPPIPIVTRGRSVRFARVQTGEPERIVDRCVVLVSLSVKEFGTYEGRRRDLGGRRGRDRAGRLPYWLTMSGFMPPSAPSRSFFSWAPTLNLSRLFTRSSTSALNSASVIFMPLCASFIEAPV